jgi:hypothetical protein
MHVGRRVRLQEQGVDMEYVLTGFHQHSNIRQMDSPSSADCNVTKG